MPSPSQISAQRETYSPQESTALRQVISINRTVQVRREIGFIANNSLREGLISQETYDGYKDVATNVDAKKRPGGQPLTMEKLESMRKFASDHEAIVYRIHEKIMTARGAGIASEGDEHFLMHQIKLKVKDFEFDQKSEWYEKRIDEKLAHMKKDRESYDKLAEHELIKNVGYLKVGPSTKIEFPKADEFLAMSVPERRELLKNIQEALPEAQQYAKEHADQKSEKLGWDYQKKLDVAVKKGIIGEHTVKEFKNGFGKLTDHEEQEYWLSEFDVQMERYETLWDQDHIGSLRGEALEDMKSKIDKFGYTELFAEFGKVKEAESKRLIASYVSALEGYREDGIIGQHTESQFVVWMNQQDLNGKYDAGEQLVGQMQRYQELWKNTETLDEKQQEFLNSKIDLWGYTELNQQYQAFKSGQGLPEVEASESEQDGILNQVSSTAIRRGIVETEQMLSEQGADKKKTFMQMLNNMFRSANSNSFDATSFESQVREKAVDKNESESERQSSRATNDKVDLGQIHEDVDSLQKSDKAKVIRDEGFIEVATSESGKTRRKTQVQANAGKSVDRFFSENAKRSYKSEKEGGTDDMSLSIWADGGRIVEMDLQEIRVLEEYLKKTGQNDNGKSKAA